MTTYFALCIATYVALLFSKNITIDICQSYLLPNKDEHKQYAIVFALLFPLTLFFLIKNKQMKSLKIVLIVAVIAYLGAYSIGKSVSLYNQSVDIHGSFDNNQQRRGVSVDKMKKITSNLLQVAQINDTSYYKNLLAITDGRKDAPQLFMKWVTENNPNVNYGEVSALYSNLSSQIIALRTELQATESLLQTDVRNWYLLHNKFPNNVLLFYQTEKLNYTPILSDISRTVNETGVDNEFKIK